MSPRWSLAIALVLACSDPDSERAEAKDAGSESAAAGGSGGAGASGGAAGAEIDAGPPLSRGEYLVRHVSGCGECHTPRLDDGMLDPTSWLAGVEDFDDVEPDDPTRGSVPAPNLTPDEATGLGTWSADQIKTAMRDGLGAGGRVLLPLMPYSVFHGMTDDDADAIVEYLLGVPAIFNPMAPRQALSNLPSQPALPLPEDAIPKTTLASSDPDFASAERGRYLTTHVAACVHCHTEPAAPGSPDALDVTKVLLGGRDVWSFLGAMIPDGSPIPEIRTANLTPHANGIAGYTPDDIVNVLLQGTTPDHGVVCRPMPVGPDGAYGGLTPEDAHDIGVYLTTIPPRDNGEIERCCKMCHL